jgi:regulation of enolase protein 1 (concanavalin A-like superfamily)
LPGTFSQSDGKLTVSGSGSDIWDRADAFRFVYLALDGDGMITARVLSQQSTDPWAKAGVMWRDSLDAGAKYALVAVTPGNGAAFQARITPGSNALDVAIQRSITVPQWLRLTRAGETFSAYTSANGETWTTLGSSTVPVGRRVYVGLAVCSHNEQILCQAQFDHVTWRAKEKSAAAAPRSPSAPVAPPANDTNWTLRLESAATPAAPVTGRIHGQNFIIERAAHVNGGLILRQGSSGPVEFGAIINFSGATPEALAGKTLHIAADAEKAARVTLHWRDAGGVVQKAAFQDGYALRLEFGGIDHGRLPGKIYLCLPDAEKSYLAGTFDAAIVRSKPKPKPVG